MISKRELPPCPVSTTLRVIGSKWKVLIIQKLEMKPWRFNELLKSLKGISKKVLSETLRSMENDGILERKIYSDVTAHVEYSLNELGFSLIPLLKEMENWGKNYEKYLEIRNSKLELKNGIVKEIKLLKEIVNYRQ